MYSVAFETGERAKTGKIFFLLGLILLVFLFLPHYSFALAVPYSSITEDTVWSVENSPYVLTKTLTIQNTATLTIDEGVIVKFKGTTIQVKGGLVVNGSNENHVVFSSYWDDSAGGDTNGDGGLSKPSSLDYWQVYFFDSLKPRHLRYIDARYSSQPFYLNQTVATSTLSDVTISHVGSGIGTAFANIEARNLIISDAMRHALWLNGGVIDIENGDFSAADFYREGVSINYGANVRLHNIKVRELQYGPAVKVTNSNVSISSSTFSGNPGVGISVSGNTNVRVSSSVIENNASSAVYASGGNLVMEDSVIRGNRRGIDIVTGSGGAPSIFARNSVIVNNELGGVRNGGASGSAVDVRENYWGDASGPYHATENPGGLGNLIQGEALFTPWLSEDPTLEKPAGFSSVAFIPGLEASRLYRPGFLYDDRLWEPNFAGDVEALYLSSVTGESLDPDIYTGGVLDEIFGVGGNIYKGFISFMEGLVSDGTISEFTPLPYDWRKDARDVVANPVKLKSNTYSMITEIKRMAAGSKSGKVTLIAHSNGGLVAKEIINALDREGKSGLIDKLILVASPALGTPEALDSMLHGAKFFLNFPSKETTRELVENMRSGYTLLPSREYFERVDTERQPIVEFSPGTVATLPFRDIYGTSISDYDNLRKFILGENGGRLEPDASHVATPNVLKENFLISSEEHHALLDSWTAPQGIRVVEIAGWGLATPYGVRYDAVKKHNCAVENGLYVCRNYDVIDPQPLITYEGDETVVYPSAVAMGGERYFLNLDRYNESKLGTTINRSHKNIFEVPFIHDLINLVIVNQQMTVLPDYVTSLLPQDDGGFKHVQLAVHSPVTLHIYDSFGAHTGLVPSSDPVSGLVGIEEQIPNSYYWQIGEGQYAGSSGDTTIRAYLNSYASGTFTLEIKELNGEVVSTTTVFKDIPISTTTVASIATGPGSNMILTLDMNGDSVTDVQISPGGLTPVELIGIIKGFVSTLNLKIQREEQLYRRLDKLERELLNERKNDIAEKEVTEASFNKLINLIEQYGGKGVLSKDESLWLIDVVKSIKTLI